MPSNLLPSSAKPAIGSVSRCVQVFFNQSLLRPETYRLSRTFDTTPSRPTEHACLNISRPSISKLSLNWTSVSVMIFLSSALRSISGTLRRSYPLRYSRLNAANTILVDLPLSFILQDREIGGAIGCG